MLLVLIQPSLLCFKRFKLFVHILFCAYHFLSREAVRLVLGEAFLNTFLVMSFFYVLFVCDSFL
jgi:hypothetical protein